MDAKADHEALDGKQRPGADPAHGGDDRLETACARMASRSPAPSHVGPHGLLRRGVAHGNHDRAEVVGDPSRRPWSSGRPMASSRKCLLSVIQVFGTPRLRSAAGGES